MSYERLEPVLGVLNRMSNYLVNMFLTEQEHVQTMNTMSLTRRVMPYMCHTETCRRSGYTFWPSNPRRVSFPSLTLKQGDKFVRSL